MAEKETVERAERDKRRGKSPSTQAGEFVREEIHHVREGKHGARSAKQAIAIGLSKARRAGVRLRPPRKGRVSEKTRRSAARAYSAGRRRRRKSSRRRSRAAGSALRRERKRTTSRASLSRQTRQAARQRTRRERAAAARRAARTKGRRGRSAAARKAARTRARRA